jgi:hypothetical protein
MFTVFVRGEQAKNSIKKTVKMYISDKFSEMVYKGYFTYYKQEYEQTVEL